jgi:hypothetical protein
LPTARLTIEAPPTAADGRASIAVGACTVSTSARWPAGIRCCSNRLSVCPWAD